VPTHLAPSTIRALATHGGLSLLTAILWIGITAGVKLLDDAAVGSGVVLLVAAADSAALTASVVAWWARRPAPRGLAVGLLATTATNRGCAAVVAAVMARRLATGVGSGRRGDAGWLIENAVLNGVALVGGGRGAWWCHRTVAAAVVAAESEGEGEAGEVSEAGNDVCAAV